MTKYLTIKEIAEHWDVSTDVVYSYIAAGVLNAVKIGRSWRIKPKDLEAFERAKMLRDQEELKSRRVVRI